MPGKCVFNDLWLNNEDYKIWLLAVPSDKNKARCKLCAKTFEIAYMGESSLKAHMKGKKHVALQNVAKKQPGISVCLKQSEETAATACAGPSKESASQSTALSSTQSQVQSFFTGKEVLSAEVLWALKCASSHFSFNSNTDVRDLFKLMFPDSDIAKQFTISPKKVSYLCCFGIAPHFKELLIQSLTGKQFVLLFDETLNSYTQSKQMDVFVRFWHPHLNEVCTKYLNSVFLGHSTASDLVEGVKEAIKGLNLNDVVQISMDGPAVNLKMYDMLQKEIKSKFQHEVLNVGTCGLHVLHNAIKAGEVASGWNLDSFLCSIYRLFKDSPARVEDFKSISNSNKMPLKFCSHRWLDNLPALKRAIEILEDIKLFVECVEKKKFPKPNNFSYKDIVGFLNDKFILIKLHFFSSVMALVQPFLTIYQTDKPMLPFFASDLTKLIRTCLIHFSVILEGKMKDVTLSKLHRFECDEKLFNVPSKVSVGFSGDKLLKDLLSKKNVTDTEASSLKRDAQKFIFAMISKILEKSPMKYSIVRNMTCFDPKKMASDKEYCLGKIKMVMNYLVDCGQIKEDNCEPIMLDFREFFEKIDIITFSNFSCHNDRLDHFFFEHMFQKGHTKAWEVIQIVLLLSHGQASVERGFSINRKIEVENLKEQSYVALRLICDYLKFCGGIANVPLTKELLSSAAMGRKRYMLYLDEKKKEAVEANIKEKKRKLQENLENLKSKRKCIESDVKELLKSADELSIQAEKSRKIEFCIKSNSLRKTAKEKEDELKILIDEIEKKTKELKG